MLQTNTYNWIIQTLAESFQCDPKEIEERLKHDKDSLLLDELLNGEQLSDVFIYYQPTAPINCEITSKDVQYELFLINKMEDQQKEEVMEKFSEDKIDITCQEERSESQPGANSISQIDKFICLVKDNKRFMIRFHRIKDIQKEIREMNLKLDDEELKVEKASWKVDLAFKNWEREIQAVKVKEEEIENITKVCKDEPVQIEKLKEIVEKGLSIALPSLGAAMDATAPLLSRYIAEIRAMKHPHDILKTIMDCVCILLFKPLAPVKVVEVIFNRLDYRPYMFIQDSWEESGKLAVNDCNFFLSQVQDNKIGNMLNEEQMELLEPYLAKKNEFLNLDNARRALMVAEALCKWVYNLADYYEKSKNIRREMNDLASREDKLEVSRVELFKACAELGELKAYEDLLMIKHQRQIKEKNILEENLMRMKKEIAQVKNLAILFHNKK